MAEQMLMSVENEEHKTRDLKQKIILELESKFSELQAKKSECEYLVEDQKEI